MTKEEEIRSQMRALLVRVGDLHHIGTSLSSLEENVEGLAGALGDELAAFGGFLADFILTAAAQLSMQTPVYATLVGLLNAREEEFGAKVVQGATERLDDMIRKGRWVNAKLLLRFFCELVNARVVKAEGVGSLGELLTALLRPVEEPSVPAGRKDLYCHLVLSVLPWAWDALAKEWPDGLPKLLETAFAHVDVRAGLFKRKGLRCILEEGLEEADAEAEDGEEMDEGKGPKEPVLDSLQTAAAAVRRLAATLDGGEAVEINAIVKPWRSVKEELAQGIRHAIPLMVTPDPDPQPEKPLPQPLPMHPIMGEFDIFDAGSGERAGTVASVGALERWVVREYLKDSLVTFRPFVTEAGVKRGSYAAEVDQLLSISYLAPPDVATEFLAVEAMLLWLLQTPGRDLAYLHRLLMQAVQTPKAAAALALGVHLLFQDFLEVVDHVAAAQLAEWFGSHLSNTQFAFPYWDVWARAVAEEHGADAATLASKDHPQLFFLRRALDVAARHTYVGKVKELVPAALHPLVPAEPYAVSPYLPPSASVEEEATPSDGEPPATAALKGLVRRFKGVLQGEATPAEVQAWLDALPDPGLGLGQADELWRVTLVAHAVSRISDNTVAHLPALLEKCLAWFRVLLESDEAQLRAVEALAEVWAGSPQMLLLALNAAMRLHMILPVNLVGWLTRPETAACFARDARYWDMLCDAVDRSVESVNTYGDMLARAVGGGGGDYAAWYAQHMAGLSAEEQQARAKQYAGAECVDHGVVAAENAQDLAMELLEGLARVLSSPAAEGEWARAGTSYLRGILQRYLQLVEAGLNRAIPGTEPIFDAGRVDEVLGNEELALSAAVRGALEDAKRYLEEGQALGGDFAHGQIFSQEE
jgi:nuclear cap-binding protein subunit 1